MVRKPVDKCASLYLFAIPLQDKRTDVVMIRKLLGYNDKKTSLRYLHVTYRDLRMFKVHWTT